MNTVQHPTLDDAVKRLMSAAKRDLRRTHPDLIAPPLMAIYARAFDAMVKDAGNAANYVSMIDAFLVVFLQKVVFLQNQKKGGVRENEVIDVIAERLQIVLEFSAAMERIQIIDGRPLS